MSRAVQPSSAWDDIETLAGFLDPGAPPYTRRPFGAAYAEARRWLAGRMAEAGLDVRTDPAGNLIGRRAGAEERSPIVLGSHVDTVLGGGRFDGVLGVAAALDVVRLLGDEPLRHPLEVVDFVAEEPTDYGPSTVGSRAWAGTLDETLLAARDASGETLAEALPRAGADISRLAEAHREPGSIAAYVELHIEQGDELERAGLDVAVVTGIVGIDRYRIVLDGEAAHSGTTPLRHRHDALAGAAEIVLAVEAEARAQEGRLVATVGRLDVAPNAANVVPGRAELLVELRALEREVVDGTAARLRALVEELCERRGLDLDLALVSRVPPARADAAVLAALERGCAAAGKSVTRLPSWAGHDASQVSLIAPFGMLFAPSRGGVSHHPDEWTSPEQVEAATEALLAGVRELDRDERLEARSRAVATYDAAADVYDEPANSFWERFGRRTVERLALPPGARVLDVCCGSGASALAAAEAVGPSGSVVGVDLAANLLSLARAKAAARGLANVDFRVGDLLDLPGPEEGFDAVVCVFGVFFVPDMEAAVRALWRQVRPGGRLAITTWGARFFEPASTAFWDSIRAVRPDLHRSFRPWDRISEPDGLRALLAAAGVADAEVADEPGRHEVASPDDWWLVVLGSGYRGTVDRLSDDEREQVRRANAAFVRDAGVGSIEANVLYATALKKAS